MAGFEVITEDHEDCQESKMKLGRTVQGAERPATWMRNFAFG
jgi:hypothetical protein